MEAHRVEEVVDVDALVAVVDAAQVDVERCRSLGPEPVGHRSERLAQEVHVAKAAEQDRNEGRSRVVLVEELLARPVERRPER